MAQTRSEVLYPNFRKEVINVDAHCSRHSLISFPFHTKGKRYEDLISLSSGLGSSDGRASLVMLENSRNWGSSKSGRNDNDFDRWDELLLRDLPSPSSCLAADISGNGFNDLVITSEYRQASDSMDPTGVRISWLENGGTDEGDWTQHDIGLFPGVNCVKVGYFTTTFSLQILAIVKSSDPDASSPLVIFTRPPDVYASRYWLYSIALESSFTAIQDCLIVNAPDGGLDYIVISSREGVSVVWYSGRTWHRQLIWSLSSEVQVLPGRLCAGASKKDPIAFIAFAEPHKGCEVAIYLKNKEECLGRKFHEFSWTIESLDKFQDGQASYSIQDIACVDIDGDGTDEIIVSVVGTGSKHGLYMFDFQDGYFVKFKLSDEAARSLAHGRFGSKLKMDLAMISFSSPSTLSILHNFFIPSEIHPRLEGAALLFQIPRFPSFISEADVLDICGLTLSLVVMPPDASFHLSSLSGAESVKVLHGTLGWIDAGNINGGDDGIIERTRAPGPPGRVTSMLVDSPEGYVRSGNDGAVFVRMRPSLANDDVNLRCLNVLPSYFTCDVREFEFGWRRANQQAGFDWRDTKPDNDDSVYNLPAFRVRFVDEERDLDLVNVQLWTAAPGVSRTLCVGPGPPFVGGKTCLTRACLSNPTGTGGIQYQDTQGSEGPSSSSRSRNEPVTLPRLHEITQVWKEDNDRKEFAWVAGKPHKSHGRKVIVKWDVWISFRFSNASWKNTVENTHACIVS